MSFQAIIEYPRDKEVQMKAQRRTPKLFAALFAVGIAVLVSCGVEPAPEVGESQAQSELIGGCLVQPNRTMLADRGCSYAGDGAGIECWDCTFTLCCYPAD